MTIKRVPWAVDPMDDRPPQLQVNLQLETDWMRDGMCALNETAQYLCFSRDIADQEKAKAFCGGCGVRSLCYAYAIVYGEQGVWGGTTEHEREERRKFIIDDVIDLWPLLHARWAGVEGGEGPDLVQLLQGESTPAEKASPPEPLSAFDAERLRIRARSGELHGEWIDRRGGFMRGPQQWDDEEVGNEATDPPE